MSDTDTGDKSRGEQPSEPQIQLKVDLFHDVRSQNKSIPDIESRVKELFNHPDKRVTDIRISVGYRASAVFLNLRRKRWNHKQIEHIVRGLPEWLETSFYADDIRVEKWYLDTDTDQ